MDEFYALANVFLRAVCVCARHMHILSVNSFGKISEGSEKEKVGSVQVGLESEHICTGSSSSTLALHPREGNG